MDQICKLYFELQNKVAEKTGFTPVVCILESEKLFLGISESRTPMFLIDCKFKSVVADLKLECISVLFNKVCKLIGDDNEEYLKTCTVIILNSENYDFQKYFLEVIYLMLQNIPQDSTAEQIKREIDKIIKLFSCATRPATKTIQGLWAELMVISQSKNPEYLIKAWHPSPKSKFDFNDGIDKVEVKSSSTVERIHTFALEQLNPNENSRIIVASVFAVQTGIGKNINDLRTMIFSRICDVEIQKLLDSIIFQTLGSDLENAFDLYFDYQLAIDELAFFDSANIPKIAEEFIPVEISNIRFSCDLTGVPVIEKDKLQSSQSILFRSL